MINLRHIKFLGIIIFSLLLSSQSFADKKFDEDLKILSKFNSFINNKGESYVTDVKFDKVKKYLLFMPMALMAKKDQKKNVLENGKKYPQLFINLMG